MHQYYHILLVFCCIGAGVSFAKSTRAIKDSTHLASVHCVDYTATGCKIGSYNTTTWSARINVTAKTDSTGWDFVHVESNKEASDEIQAFAAGYLEAALTTDTMWLSWRNLNLPMASDQKVFEFTDSQLQHLHAEISNNPKSAYWQQVNLVLLQFDGMYKGYNAHRVSGAGELTPNMLLAINMVTELGDIKKAVDKSARPDFQKMTKAELDLYTMKNSHCSGLVKVLPDFSDIFISHDTWSGYNTMLRQYKTYTLYFEHSAAHTVKLSGYPGTIPSIDDFYVTSQSFAVFETTNDIYNNSLYDLISPKSVPYWIRVTVATRMATTSPDWHNIFYMHNSGTYNNQWVTLDYKLFKPKEDLPANMLWVSEQIPGHHTAADQTMALQFGHWPSYNVPFYLDIFSMSGYTDMEKQHGVSYSYQLAPRAKIFRRDVGKVSDMDSMKLFMRENNWNHGDPLATSPSAAIAARWDLMSPPYAGGAIDSKITSADLMKENASSWIIAGPTHGVQPVFSWTGVFANETLWPHHGQPGSFDFTWLLA